MWSKVKTLKKKEIGCEISFDLHVNAIYVQNCKIGLTLSNDNNGLDPFKQLPVNFNSSIV